MRQLTAFTDHGRARVCRRKREQRGSRLSDGGLYINDYVGSTVQLIEVVIDE